MFRNVGTKSSDAGRLPKEHNTSFNTRRKFEIKTFTTILKEMTRLIIIEHRSLKLDTVCVKFCVVVELLVGAEAKRKNTQIFMKRAPERRLYKVLCVKRDKSKQNRQLEKNDRETYKGRKQKGQLGYILRRNLPR